VEQFRSRKVTHINHDIDRAAVWSTGHRSSVVKSVTCNTWLEPPTNTLSNRICMIGSWLNMPKPMQVGCSAADGGSCRVVCPCRVALLEAKMLLLFMSMDLRNRNGYCFFPSEDFEN